LFFEELRIYCLFGVNGEEAKKQCKYQKTFHICMHVVGS